MFCLYVRDARSGTVRNGYLMPYAAHAIDGIALTVKAREAYQYATISEAHAHARELGIPIVNSVYPGRVTGSAIKLGS